MADDLAATGDDPGGVPLPRVSTFRLGTPDDIDCDWLLDGPHSMLLPVREVFMMIVMDRLTDDPAWQTKVFDNESVAHWHSQVLSWPQETFSPSMALPIDVQSMLSEQVFNFCIAELRCKAEYFKNSGLIFTLNAENNNIVKSDTLVPATVRQDFKALFDKLVAEYNTDRDVSDNPVTPYKGDTVVDPWLHQYWWGRSAVFKDDVVGVADAVNQWAGKGCIDPAAIPYIEENGRCWIPSHHLLPSNVSFHKDGTVKITSYVNNLHPETHASAYPLLEELLSAALPAWDHALYGYARVGERIVHKWSDKIRMDDLAQARFDIVPAIASNDLETGWEPSAASGLNVPCANTSEARVRKPIHPQPVTIQPVNYGVKDTLRSLFGDTGLQVIIKMTTIELTQETPATAAPSPEWQFDTLISEGRKVATAIYCVESTNVKNPSIAFRMSTSPFQTDFCSRVRCRTRQYAEEMYGTSFWPKSNGNCIQNYGSLLLKQGRLVAYPTSFQQCSSQFALQDKTKPGRCQLVTLWLVDPTTKVISTANVPPQRLDWWAGAILGRAGSEGSSGKMPAEVLQVILRQLAEASPDAVKQLRLPERDLTRLIGHQERSLPVELVEMIHQHKVIPGHLFFQPANEGSPSPKTVDRRQSFRGSWWNRRVYHTEDWEGWDDSVFQKRWRIHWAKRLEEPLDTSDDGESWDSEEDDIDVGGDDAAERDQTN